MPGSYVPLPPWVVSVPQKAFSLLHLPCVEPRREKSRVFVMSHWVRLWIPSLILHTTTDSPVLQSSQVPPIKTTR